MPHLESYEFEKDFCIVEDFIDGGTLEHEIKIKRATKTKFTAEQVLNTATELLLALE